MQEIAPVPAQRAPSLLPSLSSRPSLASSRPSLSSVPGASAASESSLPSVPGQAADDPRPSRLSWGPANAQPGQATPVGTARTAEAFMLGAAAAPGPVRRSWGPDTLETLLPRRPSLAASKGSAARAPGAAADDSRPSRLSWGPASPQPGLHAGAAAQAGTGVPGSMGDADTMGVPGVNAFVHP